MAYTRERPAMGIVITITTHRKRGNGAVGGGRKGSTGKKAVIIVEGYDPVTVTGNTTRDLLKQVRKQFDIPPHITINEKGETRI